MKAYIEMNSNPVVDISYPVSTDLRHEKTNFSSYLKRIRTSKGGLKKDITDLWKSEKFLVFTGSAVKFFRPITSSQKGGSALGFQCKQKQTKVNKTSSFYHGRTSKRDLEMAAKFRPNMAGSESKVVS